MDMLELQKKDKKSFRKYLAHLHEDIRAAYSSNPRIHLENIKRTKDKKIFVCGMGGSGVATDLLSIYLEEVQIIAVKNYSLPAIATDKDLVIISSYSGNTEEAISCYRSARRIGCDTLILSSGGKLRDIADKGRIPFISIPGGYPPRCAVAYMFFTILRIIEELGLIGSKKEEISELIDYLLKTDVESLAFNLSEKLEDKMPIIYSSEKYFGITARWKTQFNENAKMPAFANKFPELNHNELNGFSFYADQFYLIILSFDDDISRMKKRAKCTKQVLSKQGLNVTQLDIKGKLLNKIFSTVLLGDYLSYYTALRRSVDPTPVEVIEEFKKLMGPFI